MSFVKKEWKDRIAEYINRRRLTHEDGSTELVEVARDEGNISQEGDAFNAETMNDLEERIAEALKPLDTMEKIEANTKENQLAGALALKELSEEFEKTYCSFYMKDLNTITRQCAGYCNDCTNRPEGLGNGYLEVIPRGNGLTNLILQRYTLYENNKVYARQLLDGTNWTEWTDRLDDYLPLSGGDLSGSIDITKESPYIAVGNGKGRTSLHTSISGDRGIYDVSYDDWTIVRRADGTVEIPHTTKINKKKPALCEEDCVMMSPSQFINAYGGTLPTQYGMMIIYGYSRPNNFQGDTYYLIVDSVTRVYNGHQLNGATTITWQKQMGASDFSVSGTKLTINLD